MDEFDKDLDENKIDEFGDDEISDGKKKPKDKDDDALSLDDMAEEEDPLENDSYEDEDLW
jgi:hypothetical protein